MSRETPEASADTLTARDIAAEQLRLLAQQTRTAFIGNLAVMLLMLGAFWQQANRWLLIAWASLLTLTVFLRVIAANGYLRAFSDNAIGDLRPWQIRITGAILLVGLAWSAFVLLFFPQDQPWLMVLVVVLLSGLASASIGSMSSYLPAFVAYTLPMLGTLTLRFLFTGTAISTFVGIAGLIYEGMCIVWASNLNRTIRDSIRLRFENIDLIAQLQKQKARAETASETKSRFLAAASHDLRQPLHALNLYLDLLSKEPDRDRREQHLERAREAGDALTGLLDALLDISRLDSDRIRVEKKHFPVRPLLETLYQEHALLARMQGVELRMRCGRFQAYTDPLLIERILRNLLSNALNYTSEGKVLLGCRQHGDRLRFLVADTGIGIPPEEQERIFDEFHQLHNPERNRKKGLGLGLAIVRRLANMLDAELQMHSEPGKGSMFCIEVARSHRRTRPEAPPPIKDAMPGPRGGYRILLIDDETAVLEAMRQLLERWGHRVIAAHTLDEALRLLSRNAPNDGVDDLPDLILCDYRLREGMTGLEALTRLHRALGHPVPSAIISGDTTQELKDLAAQHGIPMLPKPVPPARLRALVESLGADAST